VCLTSNIKDRFADSLSRPSLPADQISKQNLEGPKSSRLHIRGTKGDVRVLQTFDDIIIENCEGNVLIPSHEIKETAAEEGLQPYQYDRMNEASVDLHQMEIQAGSSSMDQLNVQGEKVNSISPGNTHSDELVIGSFSQNGQDNPDRGPMTR
jgi:hypothetical protein